MDPIDDFTSDSAGYFQEIKHSVLVHTPQQLYGLLQAQYDWKCIGCDDGTDCRFCHYAVASGVLSNALTMTILNMLVLKLLASCFAALAALPGNGYRLRPLDTRAARNVFWPLLVVHVGITCSLAGPAFENPNVMAYYSRLWASIVIIAILLAGLIFVAAVCLVLCESPKLARKMMAWLRDRVQAKDRHDCGTFNYHKELDVDKQNSGGGAASGIFLPPPINFPEGQKA